MKAKEKVQALVNICNECNPENEALFAIYATMKKGDYFAVGDMDLVHRGIYEILKKVLQERRTTQRLWQHGQYLLLCETCKMRVLTSMNCLQHLTTTSQTTALTANCLISATKSVRRLGVQF